MTWDEGERFGHSKWCSCHYRDVGWIKATLQVVGIVVGIMTLASIVAVLMLLK